MVRLLLLLILLGCPTTPQDDDTSGTSPLDDDTSDDDSLPADDDITPPDDDTGDDDSSTDDDSTGDDDTPVPVVDALGLLVDAAGQPVAGALLWGAHPTLSRADGTWALQREPVASGLFSTWVEAPTGARTVAAAPAAGDAVRFLTLRLLDMDAVLVSHDPASAVEIAGPGVSVRGPEGSLTRGGSPQVGPVDVQARFGDPTDAADALAIPAGGFGDVGGGAPTALLAWLDLRVLTNGTQTEVDGSSQPWTWSQRAPDALQPLYTPGSSLPLLRLDPGVSLWIEAGAAVARAEDGAIWFDVDIAGPGIWAIGSLVVQQGCSSFRVVDGAGAPLPGLQVLAADASGSFHTSAWTGADGVGHMTLPQAGVLPGSLVVSALMAGNPVPLGEADFPVDAASCLRGYLCPEGCLDLGDLVVPGSAVTWSGTVTDPDLLPVAGSPVGLSSGLATRADFAGSWSLPGGSAPGVVVVPGGSSASIDPSLGPATWDGPGANALPGVALLWTDDVRQLPGGQQWAYPYAPGAAADGSVLLSALPFDDDLDDLTPSWSGSCTNPEETVPSLCTPADAWDTTCEVPPFSLLCTWVLSLDDGREPHDFTVYLSVAGS
jgi:hypothetical protein